MIARAGTQWKGCPYRAADSWTWCLKLGYTPSPKSCGHLFTGKIWIHATGNLWDLWDVGILQIPYRVTIEILGYPPFRRLHKTGFATSSCVEKRLKSRGDGCVHTVAEMGCTKGSTRDPQVLVMISVSKKYQKGTVDYNKKMSSKTVEVGKKCWHAKHSPAGLKLKQISSS